MLKQGAMQEQGAMPDRDNREEARGRVSNRRVMLRSLMPAALGGQAFVLRVGTDLG